MPTLAWQRRSTCRNCRPCTFCVTRRPSARSWASNPRLQSEPGWMRWLPGSSICWLVVATDFAYDLPPTSGRGPTTVLRDNRCESCHDIPAASLKTKLAHHLLKELVFSS